MGFLDGLFDLPEKIVEGAAEAATRLPEIPIKAVKGLVKGVEKGVEKVEEALDDALDD